MTILGEILGSNAVSASLPVANRKSLFAHFGAVAEREYGLDTHQVIERLTERERLGSTGFGSGVAIEPAVGVTVPRTPFPVGIILYRPSSRTII